MSVKRLKFLPAVTLIEVMVAIIILSVGVLGAAGYRYYCALDARKADEHITAARLGLLLLESWNGVNASTDYDPVAEFGSELAIEPIYEVPEIPLAGFGLLGVYRITIGSVNYDAMLLWQDVSDGLRAISVIVVWGRDTDISDFWNSSKSFRLTTYTST